MKDETGRPVVCVHCGARAVSYDRLTEYPVCWRHLQPAIYAATAESLGRIGLADSKAAWLAFSRELARRYSEPAAKKKDRRKR